MSDPTSASASPFTPSELVVLHGEKFAEEGGMLTAREEALVSRIKVSAEKLAHAALAAALLANEQAGVVRLEPRKGSALFGLMKTDKVHVVAGDRSVDWPEGTLEYSISIFAHSGPTLQDLVSTVIGDKSHNPGQRVCGIVKAALAGRDLMDVAERKMLGLITVPQFILREEVRQAAMAESPAGVQALLRATEQGRPELWQQIIKEIRAAMVWMTESND